MVERVRATDDNAARRRPSAEDEAEQLAARFPELTLCTDPARTETFIHQCAAIQVGAAQAQLTIETLLAWAAEQHRQPAGGIRMAYLRNPANQGTGPDCDLVLPFR